MRRSAIVTVIVVILVIAAGAYALSRRNANNNNSSTNQTQTTQPSTDNSGSSGTSSSNNSGSTANNGQSGASVLTLNTNTDAKLGKLLVAPNGMTLYMFTRDTANVSNCSGQCAALWPPYTLSTTAASSLAGGLDVTGKIGTITRADGTMQVTYNSQPLYFYAKDKNPGDTTGQNVGGVWFVVHP